MFKTLTLAAAFATLTASAAFASGTHDGGHEAKMKVGEAGKAGDVTKRLSIEMKETDDGKMIYKPASIEVREGQTVEFTIVNKGELEHEFVLDEHDTLMEHKETMAKFPEMEHDDPNAIRLEPGKRGKITWKFANTGTFEFACLIPGHYESGMKGDISVTEKSASK